MGKFLPRNFVRLTAPVKKIPLFRLMAERGDSLFAESDPRALVIMSMQQLV